MKSGKAPGLDGFPVECLKKGGMAVLEWLVRLLKLSFDRGVVHIYWRGACIVPCMELYMYYLVYDVIMRYMCTMVSWHI